MFTYILLLINLLVSLLGIYFFDYQVDNMINQPGVIALSILVGTIVMLLVFWLYIEVFYVLIAKTKEQNSMVKHAFANQIMAVPLFATNTRIKVVGEENLPKDPGFSIYSNHTSMMDIPVLMCALKHYPIAFLAKKVIIKLFAVGKWTPQLGCVMIDRSNPRKGAEAIIKVIKNVKSGSTMVIFPEGTRTSETGTLIDFKPGSFKVALKSKAPLVPITIQKPINIRKVKWPLPRRITVIVHKPIQFNDFKHMTSIELAEHVKAIIQSAL